MTTQSTSYPDTNAPSSARIPTDGRTATETLEAAGPALKVRLREMVDSGRTRVTEWKGGVEDGIRAKPIQSVLIAAAVGAVVGVLIGRRTR